MMPSHLLRKNVLLSILYLYKMFPSQGNNYLLNYTRRMVEAALSIKAMNG